jgi:2-oxoglutarate dehydrogenase E2 component (dihydrolipoamide succinyltransferase)
MTVSVTMPALGESVTEGTVTRWLKQEGDTVQADEPLLEVSTDKVDTEIPAPASGVLVRIVAREDETVQVGGELAVIGDAAAGSESAPAEGPPREAPADDPPVEAAAEPVAPEPEPQPAAEAEPQPSAPAPAATGSGGPTTAVLLPALGESVTEGTVTRWLKAVGDAVALDEPLLEVSTDKVDTEIPAPAAGVLLSIDAAEDSTVPVGTTLGVIGAAGASSAAGAAAATAPPPAAPRPAAAPPAAPRPAAAPSATPEPAAPEPAPAARASASTAGGDETYVTPLVRKLAAEHGIDLGSLTGTGVGGRIRKQDVLEAAERQRAEAAARAAATVPSEPAGAVSPPVMAASAPAAAPLRGRTEPLSRLRKVIAQRMVESLQVSAQLTTVVEVDVTRIAGLRARARAEFEAREGVKLSFLPFFAKAAVDALRTYPQVNASIDTDAGTVTYHEAEHLGIAVDTERGLLVPVIRSAGDLTLAGLARKITDLAERTRGNKITPDELSGGTFTLTNTGSRGALFDTPIINQPQVAILGTGTVVKRPVVVADPDTGTDGIAIRSMAYFALTYDHRLVDGADAARFLVAVKQRLEEGAFEAELGL